MTPYTSSYQVLDSLECDADCSKRAKTSSRRCIVPRRAELIMSAMATRSPGACTLNVASVACCPLVRSFSRSLGCGPLLQCGTWIRRLPEQPSSCRDFYAERHARKSTENPTTTGGRSSHHHPRSAPIATRVHTHRPSSTPRATRPPRRHVDRSAQHDRARGRSRRTPSRDFTVRGGAGRSRRGKAEWRTSWFNCTSWCRARTFLPSRASLRL